MRFITLKTTKIDFTLLTISNDRNCVVSADAEVAQKRNTFADILDAYNWKNPDLFSTLSTVLKDCMRVVNT